MKVILHTEFDIFTYKAVGAAVGILIYAILAYKFSQIDLLVACAIAFLIGSMVWYSLYFILIKRNGVCVEFRYSKNRPKFASVTLSKKFKQLDYMEFELSADVVIQNREFDEKIFIKLKRFFNRSLSKMNEFEIIHFVGCTKKDANIISEILKK